MDPSSASKQVSSVYSGPRRQPFPEQRQSMRSLEEVVMAPVEIIHSLGVPGALF